jgi:hypothetical protein
MLAIRHDVLWRPPIRYLPEHAFNGGPLPGKEVSGMAKCREAVRQVRSGPKPGRKPVKVSAHRRSRPSKCK